MARNRLSARKLDRERKKKGQALREAIEEDEGEPASAKVWQPRGCSMRLRIYQKKQSCPSPYIEPETLAWYGDIPAIVVAPEFMGVCIFGFSWVLLDSGRRDEPVLVPNSALRQMRRPQKIKFVGVA